MNGSYGSLKEEDTDNNEITNDKELRKMKKKLRKINQNDIEGIRKLEILIDEYENRTTEIKEETKDKTKVNDKAKANAKAKAKEDESNGFLEKEYQKNKARNAKKYAEQYAEQERVKEQKKKSDEEKRKYQGEEKRKEKAEEKRRYQDERQRERELHLPYTDKIIQDHGLKKTNLPSDILEIIYDYSHKLWRKLSLKYHPDKYEGGDTYSKLLNSLKDNH